MSESGSTPMSMNNATTVERRSDRELVVTRTIRGPARLVFEAWTRPELFKRWWAPKSFGLTLISYEADVRTGGTYHLVMGHPSSDKPMSFFGRYVEVTPPSRLVWTNDEGDEEGAVTKVTFEERGGETLVVVSDLYPTREALDDAIASGSTSGWGEQFEQLDALVVTLPADLGAHGSDSTGSSKEIDTMTPTIAAFERSPDGGKGLARDTRVRWALEEVSQPYDVRLVSFQAMKQPAHLGLHPFGQIPTYEDGDLVLFETGAIVLHIAQQYEGLLPEDADARARAITWMFAALNTVEPPILDLTIARILEGDKPWAQERLPLVMNRARVRLGQLSVRLGDADWLDGAFSAGDLLMVSVLLRFRMSGLLDEYSNLAAYVARGEARPAYQRAFAAQLAINAPPS